MPYFISGVTADHNSLISRKVEEFRSLNGVDVFTRHRVDEVDAVNMRVKVVDLDSGGESWADYTRLLLATGASAVIPPLEGTDLPGVFPLRKLEDSLSIKEFLKSNRPRRAVIVGAGPIGMEMSESFRTVGLEVSVVEMADQVMPYMDGDLAARVQAQIEKEGVNCLLGQRVEAFEAGPDGALGKVITSGGELEADLALLAIGVKPVTDLATAAGVELGVKGAIRVDGHMRTSVPGIYAAGDCATTRNVLTGREAWVPLGSTSRKQGRLVADNMFGGDAEFPGVQGTAVVKAFDLTVGRTGLSGSEAVEAGFEPVEISMEAESLHAYYPGRGVMDLKLVADLPTGRLLGAQVVGEMSSVAEKRLDIFVVAIRAGLTADESQYLDLAYAPPYSTAVDVPVIAANLMVGKIGGKACSCNGEGLER